MKKKSYSFIIVKNYPEERSFLITGKKGSGLFEGLFSFFSGK